jgi:lysine 2,3-aminomutase
MSKESATNPLGFSISSAAPLPQSWPEEYLRLAHSQGEEGKILLAGLPHKEENHPDDEALADPIGEARFSPLPFLYRKYADRALVTVSGRCHFYCRFCFRRDGLFSEPSPEELDAIHRWVSSTPEVTEVILSGGDPLTLENEALAGLVAKFSSIPHVKRLRIHTRAPVTLPERVDAGLVAALGACKKELTVVIHSLHPDELRPQLFAALERLRSCGATLGNQSVLLRGINDCPKTLSRLFSGLADEGVSPKYLHHPDRTLGNRRFRLPIARGLELFNELSTLSGTRSLPRYVLDLPNGAGKCDVPMLAAVDHEIVNGRSRVRYRWTRPADWPAVSSAREFEWWDIFAPDRQR